MPRKRDVVAIIPLWTSSSQYWLQLCGFTLRHPRPNPASVQKVTQSLAQFHQSILVHRVMDPSRVVEIPLPLDQANLTQYT